MDTVKGYIAASIAHAIVLGPVFWWLFSAKAALLVLAGVFVIGLFQPRRHRDFWRRRPRWKDAV